MTGNRVINPDSQRLFSYVSRETQTANSNPPSRVHQAAQTSATRDIVKSPDKSNIQSGSHAYALQQEPL